MGLINITDIQNLDPATPELFNSRFGTITDTINGNIDADNIEDAAVTTPKLADLAVTTAKIADDAITSAKVNIVPTTDANGWTVVDYGGWKEYYKRTTYNQSFTGGTAVSINLSSSTLPTGMATLGNNFITGTLTQSGSAFQHQWNTEMTTSSTGLAVTTVPYISSSPSIGWIDWQIKQIV